MLMLCLSGFAAAQDAATSEPPADTVAAPTSTTVFTASADVYYRFDFAETAANNKTSFTNSHSSFELGMASVKLEHSSKKVGMVADLGFGRRAEEFSYTDDRTRFAIKQLNVFYTFKNGVKITAGSWATHVGYELVDAYLNRNYSMSYLFSYGPFSHTGIKAEKTFGSSGVMLGIANPTDLKSTTIGSKFVIGQLSTAAADGKLKAWLNFQGGKPNDSTRISQLDLVLTGAISPKFSVGLNGAVVNFQSRETAEEDFGDMTSWWGGAVYLNADPLSWLGLTLRSEYFSDKNALNVFGAFPEGGSVIATTFSLNLKADNLTIIPEIRFEKASEDLFLESSEKASDTAASFLVAAVYKF